MTTLGSVPIVGGSAAQREAVRQEALWFDEASGVGRTRLRRIEIHALPNDGLGVYRVWNSVVVLSDTWAPDQIAAPTRHELCHALDHSQDLSDRGGAVLEPLYSTPLIAGAADSADWREQDEVFANLCEYGPAVAQLAELDCGTELDPRVVEAFRWTVDAVWRGPLPLGASGASAESGASGALEAAPSKFDVQPLEDHAIAVWYSTVDGLADPAIFDLYTGARVGSRSAVPEEEQGPVPVPTGLGFAVSPSVGWSEGPAVAVATLDLGFGAVARRTLSWSGDEWTVVSEGCWPAERPTWGLFAADGRVWSAWATEAELSWVTVSP